MNTLLTSDWHLTDRVIDSYRLRFVRETLPELIRRYSVEWLLILGDLTEQKDRHSAVLVNAVVGALTRLSDRVKVTVVQGNHDYYLDPSSPFFGFINNMPNMGWVGHAQMIDTDRGWMAVPHLKTNAELLLVVSAPESAACKVMFTHATFAGAKDRGHELRGLDRSIIRPGIDVYSGDVHVPQTVGPVTYVGAPYPIYFGDTFPPRVVLLDDAGGRSIEVPGPRKLMVNLDASAGEYQSDARVGDIVSLRVNLTADQVADWQRLRARAITWANLAGLMVASVAMVPPQGRPVGEATRSQRMPDDAMVRSYGERRGLDADTVKAGLNLIKDES